MKQKIYGCALMIIIYVLMISCQPKTSSQSESSGTDTSWALLPFIKVDSVNPILNAGNNEFHCPVLKRSVNWEEKDVFNPPQLYVTEKCIYCTVPKTKLENMLVHHALDWP
jgi:hypothetical protein